MTQYRRAESFLRGATVIVDPGTLGTNWLPVTTTIRKMRRALSEFPAPYRKDVAIP